MALLSEPDYVWTSNPMGLGQWRVRSKTGEIVARVDYAGGGTYRYAGVDYIDCGSAKRACEAKYPSGENFT